MIIAKIFNRLMLSDKEKDIIRAIVLELDDYLFQRCTCCLELCKLSAFTEEKGFQRLCNNCWNSCSAEGCTRSDAKPL